MAANPLTTPPPGRQLYEQARALRKAERDQQLEGATAVPRLAQVLPFKTRKEMPDAPDQDDQA